jgi:glycosidase
MSDEITMQKNRFCALALACALAIGALPTARAFPATDVRNSVDFTSDVIYQIVTDRFVDGDPSNNPKAPLLSKDCRLTHLYCGGDWKGVESKITDGYLPALGVSALLLSVPVENVMATIAPSSSSYHGYWPRDFKRVNPAFGTMADFKHLIAVAHAHGIKVMIDFVINQTSPAREDDDQYAEDGRLYDDGKLLVAFNADAGGMYHHYGETDFSSVEDMRNKSLYDLADLDQQHPAIDAYLKSAILVWLDAGIDGIRVDTVKHVSPAWQKTWVAAINSHRPVFTAGEWYVPRNETDPAGYQFANQSGMSVLDFPFAQTLRAVFRYRDKDMTALGQMLDETGAAYLHPLDQVTFLDNHDQNRITLSDSPEHHRLVEQALAFALTARGTPMIYYGTEQYMLGAGHAPLNRAMMDKFDRGTAAFGLVRRLAALRKANPALQYGSHLQRFVTPDLYIFERRFHGNTVLVAINRNPYKEASVTQLVTALRCANGAPTRYADVLDEQQDGVAITVNCGAAAVAPFKLAPGAVAVWAERDDSASTLPELGHVGPVMGLAGEEITLSGRHFGSVRGSVLFDAAPLDGAAITHWEDTLIKVRLPARGAGRYAVAVQRDGARSDSYGGIEILGAPQVSLRVVVDDASAAAGEQLFVLGDDDALGANAAGRAAGPMDNRIVYRYPSWHTDVSVPAGTALSFRFVKKNAAGTVLARESGAAHRFTTPAGGTATVRVKLNGWSGAAAPAAQP